MNQRAEGIQAKQVHSGLAGPNPVNRLAAL